MKQPDNFDHITKLYRLLSPEEWANFQKAKIYHGSSFDRGTGFLHFSMSEQVKHIAEKFFGTAGHIIIVEITRSKLKKEKLIFEKNTPTGETYPHYYGSLHLKNVKQIFEGLTSEIKL